MVAVFFGGSIFIHELGHFLAARRRGLVIERFSIGFGPKIFGWKGKDGCEYRLSWLPLGGYVALPQLADMRSIEGDSGADVKKLPPPSYSTKMIVFGAGAFFNILFALALACIIWKVGLPTSADQASTRIGYVFDKIELSPEKSVVSPALEAGLRVGDNIRALDGNPVESWNDILQGLVIGAGQSDDGRRQAIFTLERDGQLLDVTVYPQLAGDEQVRRIGIAPGYELVVHDVAPGSLAATAGFKPADRFVSVNNIPVLNFQTYFEQLTAHPEQELGAVVQRNGTQVTLTIPARAKQETPGDIGLELTVDSSLVYPTPFEQVGANVEKTYRTFASLLNPHSDVGISKLSGPVGIARVFHMAAQSDIRYVLWFTILVNVNLAIFNLLPIPVLDGGHMAFATLSKLRGRALPAEFIATAQSVFMVLLFSMIIYVTFFDVRRWSRDAGAERSERTEKTAPAK
jgi:regulator of sigma E protease